MIEPGQRYGRLVVEGRAPRVSKTNRNPRWHCVCDCGAKRIVFGANLRKGLTSSCGCLRGDSHDDYKKDAQHRYLYTTWCGMWTRTTNCNYHGWARYGGRGIKVDSEWESYLDFKSWILDNLGERPEGCSLDRIDNNGHYEPGNLRWANSKLQNDNKKHCDTCSCTEGGDGVDED